MTPHDTVGLRDWTEQQTFPADLLVRDGDLEKQISVKLPAGSVKGDFSGFDSTLVSLMRFELAESTPCFCKVSGKTVTLHFNLCGSCSFQEDGTEQTINDGQHLIYYAPEFRQQLRLDPENGLMQFLEIHVPSAYYIRIFSGYSTIQDRFIEGIIKNQRSNLAPGVMPMTMPMKWIVNTIRSSTRTGVFKRLFLEAKILELLMLQAEEAESLKADMWENAANSPEREALFAARTILTRTLDKPPTIRHLARMVGVNEFSLKKGFKDTFQETIYGFVSKLKMEQAKEMLLDGDKSIGEVASLVGYKNPQHFTAAFKKHFGVLPSKLKTASQEPAH